MGWFFLYCHFRECILPPASLLAWKVTAGSGCHKHRIVHSLWLENWAGNQTGPQTQVFPFHFKGSQLQGLKNELMATLRVMVRGAKVNAIDRPCCLQNNFPVFETTTEWLPEGSEGRRVGVTLASRLYVEMIWNNTKNFLGIPDLVYFWTVWFWFLPIILGHMVN